MWNRGRKVYLLPSPACTIVYFLLLFYTLNYNTLAISLMPLSSEEFRKLPVYCKASTKHFECRNDTSGQVYCLPESLKCRIMCSNNDQLGCEQYAYSSAVDVSSTCTPPDKFACPGSNVCIADHLVCDGRAHCPNSSDESLELCKRRGHFCHSAEQFPCRSPGHCLPANMRCDGSYDCERTGLGDYSDELDCPPSSNSTASGRCQEGEFVCPNGGGCVPAVYTCDGFKDCPDGGADELNCPSLECDSASGEFACDGRCLKAALRCDGVPDCADGADEAGCSSGRCQFQSEFHCRLSGGADCVSSIYVCDGFAECKHGEDEVCPIDSVVCSGQDYWTCKSGSHCVRSVDRCDGLRHCPDGSDEINCPRVNKVLATLQPSPAPSKLSKSDGSVVSNKCSEVFGACDQLCVSENKTSAGYNCGCLPGYRMLPSSDGAAGSPLGMRHRPGGGGGTCRAQGAAKILFATSHGISSMDSETGAVDMLQTAKGVDLKLTKFLDYDAAQKRIFFHTRDGLVGSFQLNNPTGQVTVLMRDAVLDSLAYDWTRRLLFYTVPETSDGAGGTSGGFVGVMDADSGRHVSLAQLNCPRGLAADPSSGLLYLSLWCGPRPGLYRMRMDGGDLSQLVMGLAGAPSHLALDGAHAEGRRRLYWLDTNRRGLYSCLLDGTDMRAIWHIGPGYDGIPLGLTVFEDRALWSDLSGRAAYSVDKFHGAPMHQVYSPSDNGSVLVLSAVVYHSVKQPLPAATTARPGACKCSGHICIELSEKHDKQISRVCLCDQWHILLDGGCVLRNSTGGTPAPFAPSGLSAEEAAAAAQESSRSRQGLIAAVSVTSALILLCLVSGGFVAAVCLRRSGACRLSGLLKMARGGSRGDLDGGGGIGNSGQATAGGGPAMPKINSRTPLTECEIGMEDQSPC